eukprot:4422314-Prymnesium_polylepis.2
MVLGRRCGWRLSSAIIQQERQIDQSAEAGLPKPADLARHKGSQLEGVYTVLLPRDVDVPVEDREEHHLRLLDVRGADVIESETLQAADDTVDLLVDAHFCAQMDGRDEKWLQRGGRQHVRRLHNEPLEQNDGGYEDVGLISDPECHDEFADELEKAADVHGIIIVLAARVAVRSQPTHIRNRSLIGVFAADDVEHVQPQGKGQGETRLR